jgi:hypothetical protein
MHLRCRCLGDRTDVKMVRTEMQLPSSLRSGRWGTVPIDVV